MGAGKWVGIKASLAPGRKPWAGKTVLLRLESEDYDMKTSKPILMMATLLYLACAGWAQEKPKTKQERPDNQQASSAQSSTTVVRSQESGGKEAVASPLYSGGAVTAPGEEYLPKIVIKGKWGDKPGEFGLGNGMGEEGDNVVPDGIVADDKGNIYVLDAWNNRVQKFNVTGKYLEMYPLEIFVRPTDEEFEQSRKTWNKRADGFIKAKAQMLAWINGQLYVRQKRMADVQSGKYEERVLVLKSGKFTKAVDTGRKAHEKVDQWKQSDDKGNRYVAGVRGWEKFNKAGTKVFEFPAYNEHKFRDGTLNFKSVVSFDKKGDCFLELRPFSVNTADWARVYMPDGGGMQITRWCKK